MTGTMFPCSIDECFFKINNPEKAVLESEEYRFAINTIIQAALRDVCWVRWNWIPSYPNVKKWEKNIQSHLLKWKPRNGAL